MRPLSRRSPENQHSPPEASPGAAPQLSAEEGGSKLANFRARTRRRKRKSGATAAAPLQAAPRIARTPSPLRSPPRSPLRAASERGVSPSPANGARPRSPTPPRRVQFQKPEAEHVSVDLAQPVFNGALRRSPSPPSGRNGPTWLEKVEELRGGQAKGSKDKGSRKGKGKGEESGGAKKAKKKRRQ